MKKTFAAFALALFLWAGAFAGNIKESSVPAAVKEYVEKTYPRVSPVEWNYEEKGNFYNAQFKADGMSYQLDISPKGELICSRIQVAANQLPDKVNAYLGQQYPGFKVKDAYRINRMGAVTYQVDVSGQNSNQTLTLSEDGRLLNTEH